MAKKNRNLLSGSKELRVEFAKIAHELPEDWMDTYLDKYCPSLRGTAVVSKYNKLRNIASNKSTPEPSEMKIILKIIESEKAKLQTA